VSDKTLDELHEAAYNPADHIDTVVAVTPELKRWAEASWQAVADGDLVQCGGNADEPWRSMEGDVRCGDPCHDTQHSQQTEPKPTLHAHRGTQPVCPTCGSDDPKVRDYTDCSMDEPAEYLPCGDHWHDGRPTCHGTGTEPTPSKADDPLPHSFTDAKEAAHRYLMLPIRSDNAYEGCEDMATLARYFGIDFKSDAPERKADDIETLLDDLDTVATLSELYAEQDDAKDRIYSALTELSVLRKRKADVDALIEAARVMTDAWERLRAALDALGGDE